MDRVDVDHSSNVNLNFDSTKHTMSEKSPNRTSETQNVDIEQVQGLLSAVQKSLGGAQEKYNLLEASFKEQEQELQTTRAENVKLKQKLSKALLTADDTTEKVAPFRPSRVIAASKEDRDVGWMEELYIRSHDRPLPKLIKGKTKATCAFCVLVMERDSYSLGAAVVAHRLKRLGTKADTVCLVTRDVSVGAVEALASVFDAVFQVPYLDFPCRRMATKKQQMHYGQWIERSFTKWNVLALSMYSKVLLMDADLLPMTNLDHLFKMKAPAATFSSPWAKTYKQQGYQDPYKGLKHGDSVSSSMIREAVKVSLDCSQHPEKIVSNGSYLGLGSLVLLEPSLSAFGAFIAFLRSQLPFGVPGCHSGFDEQSIVLFYYLQHPITHWTHISQEYNALSWQEPWMEGLEIKCYHYLNEKPWTLAPDVYPDLKHWYQAVQELESEKSHAGYLLEICMSDHRNFMNIFRELRNQDTSISSKDQIPRKKLSQGDQTRTDINHRSALDQVNRSRHDRDPVVRSRPEERSEGRPGSALDPVDRSRIDRNLVDESRADANSDEQTRRDRDPVNRSQRQDPSEERSRSDHDPVNRSRRDGHFEERSRRDRDPVGRSQREDRSEDRSRSKHDSGDRTGLDRDPVDRSRIDRNLVDESGADANSDEQTRRDRDPVNRSQRQDPSEERSRSDHDPVNRSRRDGHFEERSRRDRDPVGRSQREDRSEDRSRSKHDSGDRTGLDRDPVDRSRSRLDRDTVDRSRSRLDRSLDDDFRGAGFGDREGTESITLRESSRFDRTSSSFTTSTNATDYKSTEKGRSTERVRRSSTSNCNPLPLNEDHYTSGESRSSLHVFSSRKKSSSSQRYDLSSYSGRLDPPSSMRPLGTGSPMRRSTDFGVFKPYGDPVLSELRRQQFQSGSSPASTRPLHRRFDSFGSSSSGGGRSNSRSSSHYDRQYHRS